MVLTTRLSLKALNRPLTLTRLAQTRAVRSVRTFTAVPSSRKAADRSPGHRVLDDFAKKKKFDSPDSPGLPLADSWNQIST